MLETVNISGGYPRANVLDRVSLRFAAGEAVSLLGPNGAGKSTLMAALTATLPRRTGALRLAGHDISRAGSHELVAAGLALVPEGRQVFTPFSVRDNLRLGAIALGRRASLQQRYDYVLALFPRLAERLSQRAGTMSGGEQQMLAIGRALMSKPTVLLLDEPFLGLAPRIVEEITTALGKLQRDGLTILLVEQKLDIALACTSRAYIMIKGRIVLEQATRELAARADLQDLYFSLSAHPPVQPGGAFAAGSQCLNSHQTTPRRN
jgi:branched-chain amino acid transport system ATP-binding protein